MEHSLKPFSVKAIMPTVAGAAVFIGSDEKTFVIHMDSNMGRTIALQVQHTEKERPLTHDLIGTIFKGLGIYVQHIVINDIQEATFFARIIIHMENELGKKVVELDARPSDAIVLALQAEKPIYVSQNVLDQVDDITDIMNKIIKENSEQDPDLGTDLF